MTAARRPLLIVPSEARTSPPRTSGDLKIGERVQRRDTENPISRWPNYGVLAFPDVLRLAQLRDSVDTNRWEGRSPRTRPSLLSRRCATLLWDRLPVGG